MCCIKLFGFLWKPENWLIIIGPSENHVERVQLNYKETIISSNRQTTTESFGFKLNATIKGNIWLGAWKGVARRAWKYISCHRKAILVFVWSIVWIFFSVHLCEVIIPAIPRCSRVPVYLCTWVPGYLCSARFHSKRKADQAAVGLHQYLQCRRTPCVFLFKNRWMREKM